MASATIGHFLRVIDARLLGSAVETDLKKKLFLREYSVTRDLSFLESNDPVRYGAMELAIRRIHQENIEGSFAEVGVWKGETSRFIHRLAPNRTLYLFDTFEGFPSEDLDGRNESLFRDTSVEIVKKNIGDVSNIHFRKGYFPDTAKGLENERFAFVLLDLDLYAPTMAGLKFFYGRIVPGGYLFLHDYNCRAPICGVSQAVSEFFHDKPESIIELPDAWGSAVTRKLWRTKEV